MQEAEILQNLDSVKMKIRRLLNSFGICNARRTNTGFVILVFVILCVILTLLRENQDRRSSYLCQSEININSPVLNKTNVHVIPSTLIKKRGWYEDTGAGGGRGADESNPYLNECVDVKVPGGLGTLLTCIHDPKKDLMVSAHLKVR